MSRSNVKMKEFQTKNQKVSPLKPGTKAPNFTLKTTPDQHVSLRDFLGRPVVLCFYPADWSPVCSDQLGLYAQLMSEDRKSTRLNSSHDQISYAVFCLKKKKIM